MEIMSGDSSVSGIQELVKLAAPDADDALLGYREPDDSGIDSDDLSPPLQPNADCITSNEETPDNPIRRFMNTAEGEEVLIEHNDDFDIFKWAPAANEADRSSPPLYEVELTASDEDDDTSVLELVIPMQSRYQRVPTSSPKKTNKKSVWRVLFCCRK